MVAKPNVADRSSWCDQASLFKPMDNRRGGGPSAVKGEGKTTTVINLGYTMPGIWERSHLILILISRSNASALLETVRTGSAIAHRDFLNDACSVRGRTLRSCQSGVPMFTTELLKSEKARAVLAQVRARRHIS